MKVTNTCPLTESLRQTDLELGYLLVDPNAETMIGMRVYGDPGLALCRPGTEARRTRLRSGVVLSAACIAW